MKTVPNPFHTATSLELGDLTVETAMDKISLYGSLDLLRDQIGLERARRLRALLDGVVGALEREGAGLPAVAAPPPPPPRGANPFG